MKITILNREYNVNIKKINLSNNQLQSLPAEIGNLRNLQILGLYNNQLQSLPAEIGNLINLQELYLNNNQLQSLTIDFLKIKNTLIIDNTAYNINNLNIDNEIIIFTDIHKKITNLPFYTTEIWLKSDIKNDLIKLPFGCVIKYF